MNAEQLIDLIKEQGGATVEVDLTNSDERQYHLLAYDDGYQVCLDEVHGGKEIKIDMDSINADEQIKDVLAKTIHNQKVGFWIEDGILFIDFRTLYIKDLDKALDIAVINNQKAVFDWSTFDSIPVE